jgi:outer membrane protein OmpA-like peptidoglycan-associated protein
LYQRAETRNDGKTLKIYSGLYVSHLKLGNLADAEKTFGQLVAVAFAENNLSIRFLFQVNSTDFISEPKLNQQYRIWVRQLGQHIIKSQQCVEVQGHSSKSGNEAYNNRLSLQRAEFIRRQMQLDSNASVNLTKATGRGFQDNLVGSGSDNEQDAIDRRVEFKIVPCSSNRAG